MFGERGELTRPTVLPRIDPRAGTSGTPGKDRGQRERSRDYAEPPVRCPDDASVGLHARRGTAWPVARCRSAGIPPVYYSHVQGAAYHSDTDCLGAGPTGGKNAVRETTANQSTPWNTECCPQDSVRSHSLTVFQ